MVRWNGHSMYCIKTIYLVAKKQKCRYQTNFLQIVKFWRIYLWIDSKVSTKYHPTPSKPVGLVPLRFNRSRDLTDGLRGSQQDRWAMIPLFEVEVFRSSGRTCFILASLAPSHLLRFIQSHSSLRLCYLSKNTLQPYLLVIDPKNSCLPLAAGRFKKKFQVQQKNSLPGEF